MDNSLKPNEKNEILNKLRQEYYDGAKAYGKNIFNITAFEQRLNITMDNKLNIESFIFEEINTIKQIKNKIEQKKNPILKKFINNIINENYKKIEHYPIYDIHPKASFELKKALGALNSFFFNEYQKLENIILLEKNYSLNNSLKPFTDRIEWLVGNARKGYSPRIEDHILFLEKKYISFSEVELDEKRFLKEIGLFLNELNNYIKLVILEKRVKNSTVLKSITKNINLILSDFRLSEFKLYC